MMELPDGFLLMVPNGFAFEIEYDHEKKKILLLREYENEVIQVKTYLPHLVIEGEGEREREMTRIMKISARLWTLVFQRKMEPL